VVLLWTSLGMDRESKMVIGGLLRQC